MSFEDLKHNEKGTEMELFEYLQNTMYNENGVEIPDDLLEGVAGGVVTDSEKETLFGILKGFKDGGGTKEKVMGYVDQYYNLYHLMYPNVEKQEVIDLINDNWDNL